MCSCGLKTAADQIWCMSWSATLCGTVSALGENRKEYEETSHPFVSWATQIRMRGKLLPTRSSQARKLRHAKCKQCRVGLYVVGRAYSQDFTLLLPRDKHAKLKKFETKRNGQFYKNKMALLGRKVFYSKKSVATAGNTAIGNIAADVLMQSLRYYSAAILCHMNQNDAYSFFITTSSANSNISILLAFPKMLSCTSMLKTAKCNGHWSHCMHFTATLDCWHFSTGHAQLAFNGRVPFFNKLSC